MSINPEIVGGIAAFLTTIAYIPQTLKILKHKHTQSLSLGMYSLLTLGIGSWLVYGIMLESPSLIVANGLTLLMALTILIMKLKHG